MQAIYTVGIWELTKQRAKSKADGSVIRGETAGKRLIYLSTATINNKLSIVAWVTKYVLSI